MLSPKLVTWVSSAGWQWLKTPTMCAFSNCAERTSSPTVDDFPLVESFSILKKLTL